MNPATVPQTSIRSALRQRALSAAERYIPPEQRTDDQLDAAHRTRTGILIAWLGIGLAGSSALLYGLLGSPVSAAAIGSIAVLLSVVHLATVRGVPLLVIGNAATALTWLVTFVVAGRTGGFNSPAIVWSFFHPVTTYVACGRRSASVWSVLSAAQIAIFFTVDRLGYTGAQDLSSAAVYPLRAAGFIGCIVANVLLIASIEGVRAASQAAVDRANRSVERQRILGDMHDGVGSQLIGLMIQVRAKKIDDDRLLASLGACLDDLKLIVDSLDPGDGSADVALAELRARVGPRFEAAGIDLLWKQDCPGLDLPAERLLQLLRALQEMTSNALRHSGAGRVEVSLATRRDDPETCVIEVRDDGIGFDFGQRRSGRGLASLHQRARRLGGSVSFDDARPGTIARMEIPLRVPSTESAQPMTRRTRLTPGR